MGEFSTAAWSATEHLRGDIDALPLLTELADGTLEPHRFSEYLAQDDFYLRGYGRALATLAGRAPTAEATAFWALGAGESVAAEVELHATLMADPRLAGQPRAAKASPTTRAYVSFLQASVAFEPYPVGVAAVREATATAIRLLDEAAAQADAPTRAAMLEAFEAATWYEHEFWARSYELEAWPF